METNSVVFFNQKFYPEPKNKPVVAAWQIINPENIGSLVRLADNVGAEEVLIVGDNFQLRQSSINRTGGLSMKNIRLSFVSEETFFSGITPGYQLVAVETSPDSENLFSVRLPEKVVFVMGNERSGLPPEFLERCQITVHIPMTGKCKSMNVSHALAVVLFEWQRQMLFPENG